MRDPMSTPDDPTRRIPPTEPPQVREREYVAGDDGAWRQELLDRLDSLRTWVVAAIVLSLLALGLGAYTLLTAEEEDDARAGASREQVAELSDRVDDLEQQVDNRATEKAVNDVRDSQQDFDERLKAVEETAEEANQDEDGADPELQSAIEDLSQSVTQLDERVADLEQRMDEQESQQP